MTLDGAHRYRPATIRFCTRLPWRLPWRRLASASRMVSAALSSALPLPRYGRPHRCVRLWRLIIGPLNVADLRRRPVTAQHV